MGLLIVVAMILAGSLYVPFSMLFSLRFGILESALKWSIALVGLILYMVLHELVHGICMKYYSKAKVHYGFTGLYAYAGSEAYYGKKAYIIIALAPVVVWGVVLLILTCVANASWFWCVYLIQICNISGAAGDLYVTFQFIKMPKDILVQDAGVSMTVYSKMGVVPEMK